MLRTRVGIALPTDEATPSGTQSVVERILNTHASNRREQFGLALKQAEMEYNEGKTSRAEYLRQRQGSIDAMRKDLSTLQKTREDLRKGVISRLDAAVKFNAGATNDARKTFSSQSMTSQASELRSRQLAEKTKQVIDDSGLSPKAANQLYNVVLENLANGPDDPEVTVFDAANTAALATDEYQELKNIPQGQLQEVASKMSKQIQSFQLNPADVSEIREQMRQQDKFGPSTLPPIVGDEETQLSPEGATVSPASTTGGARGVRPVGYRPEMIRPDISGETAELERISGREAGIMSEIENLQKQMNEYQMDDFDLIDRARQIWRQKFGRQPSRKETESIINVVKQEEPISKDIDLSVAESQKELEQRIAALQETPGGRAPPPDEPDPAAADAPSSKGGFKFFSPEDKRIIEFDSVTGKRITEPESSSQPITVPAEDVEAIKQAELRGRFEGPGPRTGASGTLPPPIPLPDDGFRDATSREAAQLRETTRAAPPRPVTSRTGDLGLLDLGLEDIVIQPEPPTPAEEVFIPKPQKLPFEEVIDETPDVYQKAEEKYKGGQITVPAIDKKTIERTVDLWKSGGKKQGFEALLEVIEKAFEDKPEDKLADTLAYFMKKFKEAQG